MWLGVVGIGGVIATIGALIFILLTVHAVFLGKFLYNRESKARAVGGITLDA